VTDQSGIAIGIATAGRKAQLSRTIDQIARQTTPPKRVIICPASPDDIDSTPLSHLPFPAQVVFGGRGLATQRNAILAASEDIRTLLFLDDDFYPAPDYLAELSKVFVEYPDVVVATGHPELDGANGPGFTHQEAVQAIGAMGEPSVPRSVATTYGGYGCNFAVRLDVARANSVYFDERLPLYAWLEDIDFSRRMASYGSIVACSALRGVHLGVKAGRTTGVRLGYSQVANPIYLCTKGSVSVRYAAWHVLKNVAMNALRAGWPEPWVDRRGRLRGNFAAIVDAMRGRGSPERILTFP
jgi:GT2 family glycosyltransferase